MRVHYFELEGDMPLSRSSKKDVCHQGRMETECLSEKILNNTSCHIYISTYCTCNTSKNLKWVFLKEIDGFIPWLEEGGHDDADTQLFH
jgi:hypothetical protein